MNRVYTSYCQILSDFYGTVFSVFCHFSYLMQRIFKYGNIQKTIPTPDKELNILIY